MIGEFEYLLITVAARLGEEAYGAAIRREVEEATRQNCSIGALYTTLERIEKKGLVTTRIGEPTPQRGGRTKRMVRVTAKGIQAAEEFYMAISRASENASCVARPARGQP
jgi:PadR family transcriptional regulator, regulatory protein PadR